MKPAAWDGGAEEVWEPSDPQLARIFASIPAAVGVPGIHLLWRRLATQPPVLVRAWPAIETLLYSTETEDCAQRLRATAFIVDAVGMPSHKAFRGDLVRAEIDADLRMKIEHFNNLSQASLSRLLVVAATLSVSLAAAPEGETQPAQTASRLATDAVYVPPLRAGEASGKGREILDRISREHALSVLDDYYRSIARIPDYLSAAWNAIRPIVGDPVYFATAAELSALARDVAPQSGSAAVAPAVGQGSEGADSKIACGILREFADQLLPQALIDVTLIKALTSGPQHATTLE
jgi:hypothetical protein